jgi:hypothetical protein
MEQEKIVSKMKRLDMDEEESGVHVPSVSIINNLFLSFTFLLVFRWFFSPLRLVDYRRVRVLFTLISLIPFDEKMFHVSSWIADILMFCPAIIFF